MSCRSASAQHSPSSAPALPDCFKAESIRVGPDGNQHDYRYAVFEPKTYRSGTDTKWPLLLFLHGSGECGTDGVRQTTIGLPNVIRQHQETFPFITIMPQAHGMWFTGENELAVWSMIEKALRDYPVDLDRIYITGLSMGGFATWDFIAKRPDVFAAAIPICGSGTPEFVVNAKDMPIWAFHGAEDPNVPVAGSRDAIEALRKAGGQPKYTEYPEGRHNVWDRTYENMAIYDWLLAHKRPAAPKSIKYRMVQPTAHVWWLRLRAEADVSQPPEISATITDKTLNIRTVGVVEWYLASTEEPLRPGNPIDIYWNAIHVYRGVFPGIIRVTPPQAIVPTTTSQSAPTSSSQPASEE